MLRTILVRGVEGSRSNDGEFWPKSSSEWMDRNPVAGNIWWPDSQKAPLPEEECQVDGSYLCSKQESFDRMMNVIVDYRDARKDDDEKIRGKLEEAYGTIKNPGESVTLEFVDCSQNENVLKLTFMGSADFPDLSDETKKEIGYYNYKKWYDENKKRGLIEFPFKYPRRCYEVTRFETTSITETIEAESEEEAKQKMAEIVAKGESLAVYPDLEREWYKVTEIK